MLVIGNVLWFILGGFVVGLLWSFAGLLCIVTVILIPWARACFVMAKFSFFPFGYDVISREQLSGKKDDGTGGWGTLGNFIFLIFGGGLFIALVHVAFAVLSFCSIIFIPFGIQHLKLAGAAIFPIGKTVVPKDLARAARFEYVQDSLDKIKGRNRNQSSGASALSAEQSVQALKTLSELRKDGLLTEEEFQSQKSKLLGISTKQESSILVSGMASKNEKKIEPAEEISLEKIKDKIPKDILSIFATKKSRIVGGTAALLGLIILIFASARDDASPNAPKNEISASSNYLQIPPVQVSNGPSQKFVELTTQETPLKSQSLSESAEARIVALEGCYQKKLYVVDIAECQKGQEKEFIFLASQSCLARVKQSKYGSDWDIRILDACKGAFGVPRGSGITQVSADEYLAFIKYNSPDGDVKTLSETESNKSISGQIAGSETQESDSQWAIVPSKKLDEILEKRFTKELSAINKQSAQVSSCEAFVQEFNPKNLSQSNVQVGYELIKLKMDGLRMKAECIGFDPHHVSVYQEETSGDYGESEEYEIDTAAYYAAAKQGKKQRLIVEKNCRSLLASAEAQHAKLKEHPIDVNSKTCEIIETQAATPTKKTDNRTDKQKRKEEMRKAFGNVFRGFGLPAPE